MKKALSKLIYAKDGRSAYENDMTCGWKIFAHYYLQIIFQNKTISRGIHIYTLLYM